MNRWFTLALVTSALVLLVGVVARLPAPRVVLNGSHSDHYSHWGSAILFRYRGWAVYRCPVRALCGPAGPAAPGLPAYDSCAIAERPGLAPFQINWQAYPRAYPVLALAYHTGPAWLFASSWARFSAANTFTIVQYVLVAHMTFWHLCRCMSGAIGGGRTLIWLRRLYILLCGVDLVYWALDGIYDAVCILCLIGCVRALRRERPALAFALFGAACGLHFRALWWLPLGLLALQRSAMGWFSTHAMLSGERGCSLDRRGARESRAWPLLVSGSCVLTASAYSLIQLQPFLLRYPINNPVHWSRAGNDPALLTLLVLFTVGTVALFARARAWLTLVLFSWHWLVMLQTHENRPWHRLFLMLPVAAASLERVPCRQLSSLVAQLWTAVEAALLFH